MDTYASISEAIYWATHTEDEEEIVFEKQPIEVKFDTSFLIDLALDTKDFEWFMQLTSK